MRITRVQASNWRNFKSIDFEVGNRLFIVGPNAAGKSNLLDLFRFLGDIASQGGGLTSAMTRRGGISKVRSLFSRNFERGRLIIDLDLSDGEDRWRYRLAIRGQQGGYNLPIVDEEVAEFNGKRVLSRPDAADREDPARLTQTHLEQISANKEFRVLAEYFAKVQYFHLVPQIIRDPGRVAVGQSDPYGGEFLSRINAQPVGTRNAWLRRMESALQAAVPEFASLRLEVDASGKPHLVAGYKNWRQQPARQNEGDFSDGTLRLIGLLWTLVSAPVNGGVTLLEEPELSLNSAIIRILPSVLASAQRDRNLQVILSTHAPELLDDEGVNTREVLVLRVDKEGSRAQLLAEFESIGAELESGLPKSDLVNELIAPADLSGLISATRSPSRR